MSKTTNTQKSNQYECFGRDAGVPLDLNILKSSSDSVTGVAPDPMFAWPQLRDTRKRTHDLSSGPSK